MARENSKESDVGLILSPFPERKSNSGACFVNRAALFLRSATVCVNVFFFSLPFDFFSFRLVCMFVFFSLLYAGHQGGAGSHAALALQSRLNS